MQDAYGFYTYRREVLASTHKEGNCSGAICRAVPGARMQVCACVRVCKMSGQG